MTGAEGTAFRRGRANRGQRMLRLIKWVFILAVLSMIGIAVHTFVRDLSAPTAEFRQPVSIDVD